MRRTISLAILGALASVSAYANAQTPAGPPAPAPAQAQSQPQAQPGNPPPEMMPPPPVSSPAAPGAQPIESPRPAMVGPGPGPVPGPRMQPPPGQWVYTQQYGWLFLPYDQGYTHVVDDAALAYEYAYYPAYGWRWVVAPWVLGFGVTPYWGAYGPARFTWYAHPWFRVGTAHLRPTWGRGFGPHPGFHMGGGHGRR